MGNDGKSQANTYVERVAFASAVPTVCVPNAQSRSCRSKLRSAGKARGSRARSQLSMIANEKNASASSSGACPVDHNAESQSASASSNPDHTPVLSGSVQEPPPPLTGSDMARLWWTNINQTYGKMPSVDGAPKVEGDPSDMLGDEPFFIALSKYFKQYGSVFKLAFGPKVFFVVSDPVVIKSILRDNSMLYDKGVLAEILAPIMGKGLIPADFETWKRRRRAIAPGFHNKWLNRMVSLFGDCSSELVAQLEKRADDQKVVDMETMYCSVALDIIGKAVFNYDFGSVTKESPIIKAVYSCLREAEHRSTFLFPYWNIPVVGGLVPRQQRFREDLKLINRTLDELIAAAVASKDEADLEELENMDYSSVEDPSLLRFLVDLRGEDATCTQLRDDLMTMLIAGHETTAAVLTWMTYQLARNPNELRKAQHEIDTVLGTGSDQRLPTMEDIRSLPFLRRALAETLRLYPEPPLLIRRALTDHTLPEASGVKLKLLRGNDIFLCLYTLHRHPDLWENPEKFDPDRFLRPFSNPAAVPEWKGYKPSEREGGSLYPNEINSDFAFLPFGGGSRKCVGDQFAILEAAVCMAMVLQRFEFELLDENVGMTTGATIHTKDGLRVRVKHRNRSTDDTAKAQSDETSSATVTGAWSPNRGSASSNISFSSSQKSATPDPS
eukprot:CAMPEP_0185846660 /NCGR_PEP_ID=MMETSP1354-20130828/2221_1 /TAXON_ID=708628 /ORGANISM="Erythrolobus madagascarensis, Strain CCMP3276" /LENGTH=668 /DNA_ID=CAMNT_0028546837 /DNA_START=145 /DNA_END=2148 /DNA_ORIENTATION=+